jgi:hypothetical protein
VGSKTFDGVWFVSFSHDHPPSHVHGHYAEAIVIVDLLPDETIRESARRDAIQPANAKRSHVKHIMDVAAIHSKELAQLWERTHGPIR